MTLPSQPSMGQPEVAADRRPIRARETMWAKHITRLLVAAGLSPNAISLSTIVFGVLGGAALAATNAVETHAASAGLFIVAAVTCQLRLLANMFDGMVALARSQAPHPTGALWNELPDRAADIAFLVGAGYAIGSSPTAGWLAGTAAILTAYVRAQGAAAGARHHFVGPMAKQHRMALLTCASVVAAGLSPQQHASLAKTLSVGSVMSVTLGCIALGCTLTIVRRLRLIVRDLDTRVESPHAA